MYEMKLIEIWIASGTTIDINSDDLGSFPFQYFQIPPERHRIITVCTSSAAYIKNY